MSLIGLPEGWQLSPLPLVAIARKSPGESAGLPSEAGLNAAAAPVTLSQKGISPLFQAGV